MIIGKKIKNARMEYGFTQEQAAEYLMVSRQTISNWENNKSLPDIISVIKMSQLYLISLDELIKGDDNMLKKIEKDSKLVATERRIIRFSCIGILLGLIISILDILLKGNPVLEFLSAATPWILLGIVILSIILYLDKQEKE